MEAKQSYLEFLTSVGAANAPHAKGSLLEHLLGTHRLLSEWQCEEHVCVAGLFHSVYSTSFYPRACVSLSMRSDVTLIIGERAERLAFQFFAAARPQAFLEAMEGAALKNRLDGTNLQLAERDLLDLVEIECANLLEQGGGESFLRRVIQIAEKGKLRLRQNILWAVEAAQHSAMFHVR
jgi:hypothetical protein